MDPLPAADGHSGRSTPGTTSGPISSPTGAPFTTNTSRHEWLACTSAPSTKRSPSTSTTREALPVPPLKSWQVMPVPPPTPPSGTGPPRAAASAANRCSARTCCPAMSLSPPSQVSATAGKLK